MHLPCLRGEEHHQHGTRVEGEQDPCRGRPCREGQGPGCAGDEGGVGNEGVLGERVRGVSCMFLPVRRVQYIFMSVHYALSLGIPYFRLVELYSRMLF